MTEVTGRHAAPQRRRLLITGSRTWDLEPIITAAILKEWIAWGRPPLTLVHGDAQGADRIAAGVINHQVKMQTASGTAEFFKVEPHEALWDLHGKAAGYMRNQLMVDLGADLCLAFIKNGSGGASDCARRAAMAGIPVVYYRIEDTR